MSAPTVTRPRSVDFSDPAPRRRRRRRLVIAALLVLITAGIVWLVWFSSVLQVREVRVVGVEGARAAEVLAAAAVPVGLPLARVDAGSAEQGVRDLPWVSVVEVRRGWPNEVVLAVEVREPVAVLDPAVPVPDSLMAGGTLSGSAAGSAPGSATGSAPATGQWGIDADGVVFPVANELPRRLPKVRAEGAALAAATSVVNGLPADLLKRVVSVSATTLDDIDLHLRSGDVVRWGSALDSETKAEVLRALLGRKADMYDVSAPELPTTFKLR